MLDATTRGQKGLIVICIIYCRRQIIWADHLWAINCGMHIMSVILIALGISIDIDKCINGNNPTENGTISSKLNIMLIVKNVSHGWFLAGLQVAVSIYSLTPWLMTRGTITQQLRCFGLGNMWELSQTSGRMWKGFPWQLEMLKPDATENIVIICSFCFLWSQSY